MSLITREGFSVVEVATITDENRKTFPPTFTVDDDQFSDDKLFVFVKGNYTGRINFDTYTELTNYIYSNGWTLPVVEEGEA